MSANSTLTTYALGRIHETSSPTVFYFDGLPYQEVSLVRVDRAELEQFQTLLLRHPIIRQYTLITWNESVQELEEGQYRCVREGRWGLEPGADQFSYVPPARVTVKLPGTLVDTLRTLLQEGTLKYGELVSQLEAQVTSVVEVIDPRVDLDRLIDLGLLILTPPWPDYEPRLEQRIQEFLRQLPEDPILRLTSDALDELLALEDKFASAVRPESSVAAMEAVFSRLLATVTPLAHHEGPVTTKAHFFEDILIQPTDRSAVPSIVSISSSTTKEILETSSLVARFAGLFNHRHDALHTLAAWWRNNEPNHREIRFNELAKSFAPIWQQFLRFQKTANDSALNTFNPLQLPTLELLRERREVLLAQCDALLDGSLNKDLLPKEVLAELLESIPYRYAPLVGSCVFVQPVDPEGHSWVLNHLHEGTGRYLSRVTPILPESLRHQFLDHLAARSVLTLEGNEADLLEVLHPWGTLVNAHPPQTLKILQYRGLQLDLPQERTIHLRDLMVQADLESESFRLLSPSGRRMLPVHLGSMSDAGLPPLLRFLLVFGPGETRGVFPFPRTEARGSLTFSKRLTCGRLILRRSRWTIGIQNLREDLEGLSEPPGEA